MDFDGLVELPVALLGGEPALAAALRERWPLISVDEYQDIDASAVRAAAPAGGDGSGTDRRSATPTRRSTASAARTWASSCVSRRTTRGHDRRPDRNYRSAPVIVTGALQAIAPATPGARAEAGCDCRRALTARPRSRRPGRERWRAAAITVHEAGDEQGGGRLDRSGHRPAARRVVVPLPGHRPGGRARRRHGLGLADIAVLYRTDAQAGPLGQALTRAGLPFQKRSHDLLQRRAAVPEIVHEMCLARPAGEAGHDGAVADRLAAAVRELAGRSSGGRADPRGRLVGAPAGLFQTDR